jgi:hypothetical protein
VGISCADLFEPFLQGAVAQHPVDGDLSQYVEACAPQYRFAIDGLAACNLDTSTVGNYTVSFRFRDPASGLASVAVARTVVVHDACPYPEVPCKDFTCTIGGVCSSSDAYRIVNNAPVLSFASDVEATIYVPRGQQYDYCGHTSKHLCEAGPGAFDLEDGFITERVLACPPQERRAYGCPGHELHTKGLRGCGLDTVHAPVGTMYRLEFQVFDLHHPPASAVITREIAIVTPCAHQEVYCPGLSIECGSASCASRAQLEPKQEQKPAPPGIDVDLGRAPSNSTQLYATAGHVDDVEAARTLRLWSVCGTPLPLDFTSVCNALEVSASDAPCSYGGRQCAVSVTTQHTGWSAKPLVTFQRERCDSASGTDTEAARDALCTECSLRHLRDGKCPPSKQVFVLQGFAADSNGGFAAGTGGASLRVQVDVVPALVSASMVMHAQIVSTGAVNSLLFLLGLLGSGECSSLAVVVHDAVYEHIYSDPQCAAFTAQLQTSKAVLSIQVTQAEGVPTSEPADHNVELHVTVTLGTTVRTSVQAVAIDCLQSIALQRSFGRSNLPSHLLQSDSQPAVLVTLDVVSANVTAAECPEWSEAERAVYLAEATIADALLHDLAVNGQVRICSVQNLCLWSTQFCDSMMASWNFRWSCAPSSMRPCGTVNSLLSMNFKVWKLALWWPCTRA